MINSDVKFLVTGSSGYIGSVMCKLLKQQGYGVMGVDLEDPNHNYLDEFAGGNVRDDIVAQAAKAYKPNAVFHFAASADVAMSMEQPALFYYNNVGATTELLGNLLNTGWRGHFIFSSTAAVYGVPQDAAREEDSLHPINPYGRSKLMCEQALNDIVHMINDPRLKLTKFRYFNVAGAWKNVGDHADASHIITRLSYALKHNKVFQLFGNQYDTRDGTCIRDYIHVRDICRAHLWAYENQQADNETFNLGTGRGYSNLEMVRAFKTFTGRDVKHVISAPRPGDPSFLVANSQRIQSQGFRYEHDSLEEMITSAWDYYNTME